MKACIAIIALSFFLCSPCPAEQEMTEIYTDTGVPTREDGASGSSGFQGTLGAGIFGTKKIIGDGGTILTAGPIILMRYKDLAYWSLRGGGVWLLQSDDHVLRFGAGIRTHPGWAPGEDPNLAGMGRRKGSLDGYLNAVWRTPLVTTGIGYYHSLNSLRRGDTASLRFSRNILLSKDLRLTPSIGGEWRSGKRVDYYYGVHPDETLPFRMAYTGTATVNMSAGLASVYRLPHFWSLLGGVFVDRYGNGIVDSPIVSRRYTTLVYLGTGWSF